MPTKSQTIAALSRETRPSFSKKEVISMINGVSADSSKPSKLKKGDVYVSPVGLKYRPVVICKVIGDIVIGIPLSTTEDCMNLCTSSSRFFGNHFFSKQVVTAPYEHAMSHFAGVFDNSRSLNKAIKLMKEFYFKNL